MAVDKLVTFLMEGLEAPDRSVRVEELISAAASVAGERCIEAAADFDPRQHALVPGSHVLSERVNELLSGNVSSNISDVPSGSVFGMLRDRIVGHGYQSTDFPPLAEVFAVFAAGRGNPSDWGRVPLSVPDVNKPYLLPLQVAYETRVPIDRLLETSRRDAAGRLRIAVLALAEALIAVSKAIDRRIALLLALETLNGMAKTAPMTDEAFRDVLATSGRSIVESKRQKPWWRFW